MHRQSSNGSGWLIVFVVLFILSALLLRPAGFSPNREALEQHWIAVTQTQAAAPLPTLPDITRGLSELEMPGLPELPELPDLPKPAVEAPAVVTAESGPLRFEFTGYEREGDRIWMRARLRNIGTADLTIKISDLQVSDSLGKLYEYGAEGQTTLSPGQQTSVEVSVPADTAGRALTVTVNTIPGVDLVVNLPVVA